MSRQVDRDSTTAYRVDVSLKLSLVLLLCLPVLMPNLEQYAGKGMSSACELGYRLDLAARYVCAWEPSAAHADA
jgi:hypothetical protein